MSLLREFVADYLALPQVRFGLKWWWAWLTVLAIAFAVACWASRKRD